LPDRRTYPDLHEHIEALDRAGLLIRVDRAINKDTEMHPLVRWQFRGGIPENQRKAFLFTNVTDSKGRTYDMPVIIGGFAANEEIYRIGMGVPLDQIEATWLKAIAQPIEPRLVQQAPCQEIVITGDDLKKPGSGLDGIPIPISTPGWDIAPYTTMSQWISKDPDTGIQNVGIYRGQVKSPTRLGINASLIARAGIHTHWHKYQARNEPAPVAIVLSGPPCVGYTAAQKVPEHLDELAVAGGLVGGPINVVRAKTVDLLIPADAEIVIEGYLVTTDLEPEAPFGESHGHMNLQEYNAYMEVTCITRRKNAIMSSIISQLAPSESSVIKRVALEPLFTQHLRDVLGIKSVVRVSMHEPLTNLRKFIIVTMKPRSKETDIWRALQGALSLHAAAGKYVIAVDEDIDPRNSDMVLWALAYRANPKLDFQIIDHKDQGHGPKSKRNNGQDSAVLINATLKETFPPLSLPKREYMEKAKEIWDELGLPALRPETPWYGYSLGEWSEEFDQYAESAARGDYFAYGETLIARRRNDIPMNIEVRDVES
jgi:UbiD family decarboxylase